VVVCEGYTDVIGLFGAGVQRAVATCGTALAEEHVKLLRGFASRVVLAFDADGAGQAAAGRFYEWERKLSIDVAVAALPAGSDPGELARKDPDGLRAAIKEAKPFLQFRVERIMDAAELGTPEGRARAADSALAAVAEHPDNLVRDQYLMQVAERCRLEPLLLRERLEQIRRDGPRPDESASPGRRSGGPSANGAGGRRRGPAAGSPDDPWVREPEADGEWDVDGFDGGGVWSEDRGPVRSGTTGRAGNGRSSHEFRPGLEALRLAIHRPEDVADRLEAALFRDDLQRTAFEILAGADTEPLHEVIEQAPPEVRALLVRLTVEEPRGQPDDVVLQLVRDAARGELTVITGEARTSSEAAAEAAQVASWVQELDDPSASVAATARLVAWLVVRAQTESPGHGS
jgi:DNA primase